MRYGPRSLTLTGMIVLLVAILVAAVMSIGLLLSRNTSVIADTEVELLTARAHVLASGLRRSETNEWRLRLPRDLAGRFDPAFGRSFYAVRDSSGRAVLSSMDPVPGEVPVVLPNSDLEEPATFKVRRGGMILQGVSVPVEAEGTPLVIQVADNIGHPDIVTDDLSAGFLGRVSWVVLPVFAALAVVVFVTLRLCMYPVEMLSRRAAELSSGQIGGRLPEDETPTEIRPLVHAVNAALDRAERAHAVQRSFTAEAAHQMRTPLAVLKTHAELIQDRRTGEALGADIVALERIVDQLLALAEVDAAEIGTPDEKVELGALAQAAANFLDPLAAGRKVDIAMTVPVSPVFVPGHEEPLYQAVLNLLQNAIDFSPPGGTVRLSVQAPGTVEVGDQGPGVPEHQRDLVFRRFWRARTSQRRGAGLGLSIVRRVAELHRGSVSVEGGPSGGALFRLTVPGRQPDNVSAAHQAGDVHRQN
jgi:signal transduction histidine kinase